MGNYVLIDGYGVRKDAYVLFSSSAVDAVPQ